MATDLSASAAVEPELVTSKSHSLTRAALNQNKRRSKHSSTIYPDPFRYGNPNPLDCHPYYSNKHPDYIYRPQSVKEPLEFPVLSATTGAGRLSVYGEDELDAYRAQGFVPRLLRVDSLAAIFEFFDGNTLSRAMASPPNTPARKAPETSSSENKSSVPSHVPVQPDPQIHLQGPAKENAASSAKAVGEVNCMPKDETIRQVPQSPKALPSPPSNRRFPLESEPPIRFHPNAGLPKGWERAHDRFIAYLDTHTPRRSSRQRNPPQYTLEQMVYLLKKRFAIFENVCIPTWAIARRLEILDCRNNNYFDMTYGYYNLESWGKGI